MSRRAIANGKYKVIYQGNHTGSSKAMEGACFVNFRSLEEEDDNDDSDDHIDIEVITNEYTLISSKTTTSSTTTI